MHDIGGKCYLLLEGMVREEGEAMADETELSNQSVSNIQNFFSMLNTNVFCFVFI